MSEEIQPVEMSAEDIRLRERRSFDAYNVEQAKRRQIRRDANNLASTEENKRWVRPEDVAKPDNDMSNSDMDELSENDSSGG